MVLIGVGEGMEAVGYDIWDMGFAFCVDSDSGSVAKNWLTQDVLVEMIYSCDNSFEGVWEFGPGTYFQKT
jgi:hypothetical protein